MKKILMVALAIPSLLACKDPRTVLNGAIQDKHFIPYELPMASTRVGTILKGNDKEMYLVARPERCFPDLPDSQSLRWTQPTDLPAQYKTIQFAFNASANAILGSGNASISLKASASYVKTVELEFKGASVEFLDEMNFGQYFANGMTEECHKALAKYAFIGQGLRIESMKFIFKDAAGGNIDLTGKLSEIVDISAGVSWKLENNYTLIIETPKYIGYRMAKIDTSTGEFNLQYATTTEKDGSWIFRDITNFLMKLNEETRPSEELK
ncbi:MAG: hypothetical protein ACXWQO_16275 [Bdellovibrionota bacterium]